MMQQKLLPGRISITYPRGDGCDYVSITIEDEASGVEFVEVRVKYAEFALALGMSLRDCEFVTRGLDLIGTKREHKVELVLIPICNYDERRDVARAAIEPLEVDGWKGNVSDALNHHRFVEPQDDGTVYKISFVRWVEGD